MLARPPGGSREVHAGRARGRGELAAEGAEPTVLTGVAVDSRHVRPGDLFVAIRGERVDGHDFAREAAARGARRAPRRAAARGPARRISRRSSSPDPVRGAPAARGGHEAPDGIPAGGDHGLGRKDDDERLHGRDPGAACVRREDAGQPEQSDRIRDVDREPAAPARMDGGRDGAVRARRSVASLAGVPAGRRRDAPRRARAPGVLPFGRRDRRREGRDPGGPPSRTGPSSRTPTIRGSRPSRLARPDTGASSASGRRPAAQVTARDVVAEAAGTRFRLKTPAGEAEVRLPLPGPHQVDELPRGGGDRLRRGPVSASGLRRAAAGELRPAAHRGEWRRHASGARLYDDSYNANPASMRAALETLAACRRRRRIAVLGDMLELGPHEEPLAPRGRPGRPPAGRTCSSCVGTRARWIGEGAVAAGLPEAAVDRTRRRPRTPRRCSRGRLAAGDVVLFKASRGIGLDRAVEALASDGAGAIRRREPDVLYWLLYPLAEPFPAFNVFRYITFRTAMAAVTAPDPLARARAGDDPAAQAAPGRPVDPRRRPEDPPRQGRHAHDGRPAHPLRRDRRDARSGWTSRIGSCGSPSGTLAGVGAVGFADDFVKVTRRRSLGPDGARQAGAAVPRWPSPWRGPSSTGRATALLDGRDVPVLEEAPRRPRHPLYSIRGGGRGGFVERREPDRRPGRAGDRSRGHRGGHVRHPRVRHGQRRRRRATCRFRTSRSRASSPSSAGRSSGASLGFLWFNCHPAEMIMGDVGALSLGAAIAAVAVMTKQEVLLAIVGGLFVLEALSVILQVGLLQAHRQAHLQDGAAPPPLRAARLGGVARHHPVLDPRDPLRGRWASRL